MTQSGVSQQIKKLEQQIGTPLLVRELKSFYLTEAGHQLHSEGQKLLLSMQSLGQRIKHDSPYDGRVSVKSPGSLGLMLYPELLDLQAQHKGLRLDYRFAPNVDIESDLIKRKLDIGLMTTLPLSSSVRSEAIAQEPLVLVTPQHVMSPDWSALMALGFIWHPDAMHHGQLLLSQNYPEFEHLDQFTNKGFSNQIGMILEPVARGIGFSVLPATAATSFAAKDKIRIFALSNPVAETIYLCSHRAVIETKRCGFIKQHIKTVVDKSLS